MNGATHSDKDPVDTLISQLGHELRSPLAAALLHLGVVERLVAPLDCAGEALASVAQARTAVASVDRIIDRTLDAQGWGPGTLRRELVELEPLVASVVQRLSATNPAAETQIRLSVARGATGHLDRTAVEEILDNLLSNALKFGQGKPIRLRVERQPEGVRLVVRDLGRGITPDEQARVFAPFVRGSASEGVPGLGLGLWIVRRLVEAHDGRISVYSRVGGGTWFDVFLPG